MSAKCLLLLSIVFFSFSLVSSQKSIATQLETSYKQYFELSRESVHLHLNKTNYFKGEEICRC